MSEERQVRTLHLAGALGMTIFSLGPILYMAMTAASRRPDFLSHTAGFEFTVAHFDSVLRTASLHFPEYLRNSIVVSGASAVFCVGIASPAAGISPPETAFREDPPALSSSPCDGTHNPRFSANGKGPPAGLPHQGEEYNVPYEEWHLRKPTGHVTDDGG